MDLVKLIHGRKYFLLKIFSILLLQLGILFFTFYILETRYTVPNSIYIYLFLILVAFGCIACIFLTSNPYVRFLLFTCFSIIIGILSSLQFRLEEDKDLLKKTALSTIGIFIFFVGIGSLLLASGIVISGNMFFYLNMALLIAICTLVFLIFFVTSDTRVRFRRYLAFFLIVIFILYIMFDTYFILQRPYTDTWSNAMIATMDYYLDIVNLFQNMFFMYN